MRRSLRSLVLLALPLLGACATEPSADPMPAGAVRMEVRAEYRDWWTRTEGCSQLQGDFSRVEWYVVPDAETFQSEVGESVALRIGSGDNVRIVIAGRYVGHEMVVRHEMLHALLNRSGHPALYFEQRCALTWSTWDKTASGPTLALADGHAH